MASNFSLQFQPYIKFKGHEIRGNDHQFKKLPIFEKKFPCQHLMKCVENSAENMHTDVRVEKLQGTFYLSGGGGGGALKEITERQTKPSRITKNTQ